MRQLSTNHYRSRPLRAVVGWALAVVAGMALIGFASDNASRFTCQPDPHSVQYGDTLWAIAEAKCEGNIQAVTDNLVDTYGTNIQLGDTIWLPTDEDCLLENRGGEIYDGCG